MLLLRLLVSSASAAPPEYITFGREQSPTYSPAEKDLLRIWMVYVSQGDGIIIQLPTKYNYEPDGGAGESERIDVVVDGGANPSSEAGRLTDFIKQLYAGTDPVIEHVVITHHDEDHVAGIGRRLFPGEFARTAENALLRPPIPGSGRKGN